MRNSKTRIFSWVNNSVAYIPVLLLLIIVYWCALRFIGIENSPPGFYVDESGAAANIICLLQKGETFVHEQLPLFPTGPGGGKNSPTYNYFAAAWTAVWGDSITAFRTIPAFFTVLAIMGLFFLARKLADTRFALFVTLIAAVSPWSFHFSRISWGPPLMVCFAIWGYYFLIRSQRHIDTVIAAILVSLAMYSYQAARVSIPLILLLLVFSSTVVSRMKLKRLALFAVTGIASCIPLVLFTFTAGGLERFGTVSILSKHYIQNAAHNSMWELGQHFVLNMLRHFTPEFLIYGGDHNLRHSPPGLGQLGYLEIAALTLLIIGLIWQLRPRRATPDNLLDDIHETAHSHSILGHGETRKKSIRIIILAVAGIIAGTAPAALTWESLPHALRSIAAWPFYALLTGWIFWRACHFYQALIVVPAITAIIFTIIAYPIYFTSYPKDSDIWFDASIKRSAENFNSEQDWKKFIASNTKYDDRANAYYLMHYGDMSCTAAQQFIADVRKQHPSSILY